MREIIMGYQGEMSLKGLNRNQFESAMMKILRYRLKTVGKFKVYCTQSTFYMEPEEEDVDMDLAFDRVRTVFGLAALSRAVVCEKDFDTICRTAEEYLGDSLHGIKTFKVEARRSDKTYPMTSPELMRELGAYLLGLHNYLRVDVKNPQFKVIVEIRDYGAYIHGPKIPGEGGLPVGTSGRALNMLSGGIDSPVAAYRMAKRGLALDHIHFASPPYTSERAKLKVKALAQKITPYTGSSNSQKCQRGGTAMFAFLALAGDLGATVSPTIVGNVSNMFGGNLKIGLCIATAFPLMLILGLIILNQKFNRLSK